MGEFISIQGAWRANLSCPAGRTVPGVILFHAWWGLNAFFRVLGARLSGAGIVSLAPDYLGWRADPSEDAAQLAWRRTVAVLREMRH